MRKVFLFGLVTFVIVSVAALGINWLSRSSTVKEDVKKYLASFKSSGLDVTYDSITTSGFPFSMNVSIANPHFVGDVNQILKRSIFVKNLNVDSIPKWTEDYTLSGSIDLSVNALSDKFNISVNGSFLGKADIAGKLVSISTQYATNTCNLNVKRSSGIWGNLWDFYILSENKETVFADFRTLDCTISSGKAINNDTKETILTYDGMRVYLTNEPKGNVASTRFYIQIKDMEATKAYDSVYATYIQALAPNTKIPSLSLYGKQNIEVDLSYNGSSDWKSAEAKNIPLDFKINKFFISNAAYNSNTNFSVASNLNEGTRKALISFKSEATATELLAAILKEHLHSLVSSVLAEPAVSSEVKEKLSSMSPEALDKLITSVIPDYVALGEMVSAIDVNYSGKDDFSIFQTDLTALEFSASPYGITAKGSAKRDEGNPIPYGDILVTCTNCLKMIDDIVDYANRVKNAISVFSPEVTAIDIAPEKIQAVKDFLVALQEPSADKSVIKFDLVNDDKKGTLINGKSVMQVMELYGKILQPVFQKQ